MDKNKYSTMRVVLIFLAIVSIVLAVLHVVKLAGADGDKPQADLSEYGSEPEVSISDGLIFDDDATMEMDSIPNDAMISGSDISGTDVPEIVVSGANAG